MTTWTAHAARQAPCFATMQPIAGHRETLYKEVQKEPTSILARRYNISDVGLAKVCHNL
jgi:hypothetical protein